MEPQKQKSRRKNIIALASVVFLTTLLFLSLKTGQTEASSISKKFNYQGRLGDASGVDKADGAYDMVFKIYSAAGGGSALWTETWTNAALWSEAGATTIVAGTGSNGCTTNDIKISYSTTTNESSLKAGQTLWNTTLKNSAVVATVDTGSNFICVFTPAVTWNDGDDLTNRSYVKNGIFSITLGTVSDQTLDFSSGDYYLGVTVGADAEMVPRKPLTSVPQAINANNLKGDGSIDLDNMMTTGDAANINYNPASGTNNALVVTYGNAGGTGTALKVTQSGTGYAAIFDGGNVGIGTTAPANTLQVNGALGLYYYDDQENSYDSEINGFIGRIMLAQIGPIAGNGNVALGHSAISGISKFTGGLENTAIGTFALYQTVGSDPTGSSNTALGARAGYSNITGSGNLFLGFSSGYSETGSNKLWIANSSTTSLVYGDFSTGMVGIGGTAASTSPYLYLKSGGNVGIGTTNPLALFSVGSASPFQVTSAGMIGLGGTTPLFSLGVDSTDSNKFKIYSGSDIAGTSEFTIDSNGVTSISNLQMGANFFPTDAGMVSWVDMPVTDTPPDNTVESYTAQLDGNPMLTIYGLADSNGAVDNLGVGIGTTAPAGLFDVNGKLTVLSGGNVGIGTTAPGQKLTIDGVFGSQLRIRDSSATRYRTGLSVNVSGATFDAYDDTGTAYLPIQIDANKTVLGMQGNVGIGTTDPGYDLEVVGNIYASGNITCGGSCGAALPSGATNQTLYYNGAAWTATSNLTNTGTYVGIGISVPTVPLEVVSTATSTNVMNLTANALSSGGGMVISSTATGNNMTGSMESITLSGNNVGNTGNLLYLNSSGANTIAKALNVAVSSTGAPTAGFVNFNFSGAHTNNGFQLDDSTNTGTAMAINANALSSGSGLIISSSSTNNNFTGTLASLTLSGNNAGNTGTLEKITISGASTAATGLMITNLGTGYSFRVNDETGDTDTTPFVIDASGNVGIGTTGPVGQLTLSMIRANSGLKTWNITDAASLDAYYDNSGADFRRYLDIASIGGENGSAGGGVIRLITNPHTGPTGIERMRIDETGYVGIGTTNPFGLLSVGSDSPFQVTNTGMIGLGGTTPLFSLGVDSTDSNKFKIYSGSSIAGTSEFTIDSTGLTSIANLELGSQSFADDSGQISWIDMAITDTPADDTVESYTAQLDGNPMLTIYGLADSNGAVDNLGVGIGTTTPGAKLDVQKSASGNIFALTNTTSGDIMTVLNGGNVGIGTTNPGSKLTVSGGNIALEDNRYITGNGNNLLTSYSGDTYLGQSNNTIIRSGNAGQIFLKDGGNVGIGTTNPGYDLEVVGNIYASGNITCGGSCGGGSSLWTDTGSITYLGTGGVAQTDNVGIGTTNPGTEELLVEKNQNDWTSIHVSNTTNDTGAGAEFWLNSASSNGGLDAWASNVTGTWAHFADRITLEAYTDAGGLDLMASAGAGDMRFYTGGKAVANERMRILSGGNVGIGTTDPLSLLHVYSAAGNALILAQTGSTGDVNAGIQFVGGSANANWQIGTQRADIFGAANNLGFYQVGGTGTVMVLEQGGNIGIGTTNPGYDLEVVGNIYASGNITCGGSCGGGSSLWTDTGSITYLGTGGVAQTDNVGIGTTNPLGVFHVGIGATNPFFISSAGNVGIGTTGSTNLNGKLLIRSDNDATEFNEGAHMATLVLESTSNSPYIVFREDSTRAGEAAIGITGDSYMELLTGGANRHIILNPSGNVGIGTTAPVGMLHIGSTSPFVVLGSGYVGIGTTAPTYMVDLNSISNTSLFRLAYGGSDIMTVTNAQTTFNNPVNMASAGDVSMSYDLLMTHSTAGNIKFQGPGYVMTDSSWQNLDLTLSAANTGEVIVDDEIQITGSRLHVDGTTGYVGIGTTNPTALLSLIGSTTARASLNIAAGTAPASPNNGDMWYEAGHLYFRDTTTKDILAGGASLWTDTGSITYLGVGGVAQTDSVGIGTTAPVGPIDIKVGNVGDVAHQNLRLLTADSIDTYNLGVTTDSSAGRRLITSFEGGNYRQAMVLSDVVSATNTMFGLSSTTDGATWISRLAVLQNGNVGIGTTSPTALLSLAGSTTTRASLNIAAGTAPTGGDLHNGDMWYEAGHLYFRDTTTKDILAGGASLWTDAGDFYYPNNYSSLAITDTGRLGIGTTSPTSGYKLDIDNGTADYGVGFLARTVSTLTGIGNIPVAIIANNTNTLNSGVALRFGAKNGSGTDNTNLAQISAIIEQASTGVANYGGLQFTTTNGTTIVDAMRISNGGNVGIGTTNPVGQLNVHNPVSGYTTLKVSNADTGNTATDGFDIVVSNSGFNAYLYNRENAGLWLGTNNTERLVIAAGGNVGIGTTNPLALLSVGSASPFQVTSAGMIGLGGTTPLFSLGVDSGDANKFKIYSGSSITGTSEFTIDSDGTTSISNLKMGELNFPDDAGIVSWVDMAVSGTPADDTAESYTAYLDGNPMLTIYGLADSNGAVDNLRVGIGTETPNSNFHVLTTGSQTNETIIGASGTGNATLEIDAANGDAIGSDYLYLAQTNDLVGHIGMYSNAGRLDFETADSPRLTILQNGNVGIGTTNPSVKLNVVSTADENVVTIADSDGTCTLNPESGGAWSCTSDERLKKNIYSMNVSGSLSKIMDLRPTSFTMKQGGDTNYGFIAQEVQNVIPEAVSVFSNGYLGVAEGKFTPYIVGAIQEQQGEISNVKLQISNQFQSSNDQILKLNDDTLTTNEKINLIGDQLSTINQESTVISNQLADDQLRLTRLEDQMKLIQDQTKAVIDFELAFNLDKAIFKDAEGNVDLLGGKLEAGGVVAGAFTVKAVDPDKKTIGTETIHLYEDKNLDGADDNFPGNDGKSAEIKTKAVTTSAKIFVTPQGDTGGSVWAEKQFDSDTNEYTGFKIKCSNAVPADVAVDWFIVEEK